MPLMSITAPQKHLDWPLASCVGSLHPESHIAYFHTVQALGAVVTQCTFIQITTAITPKDPMTVRTTKQRSKKIHLIRWCGFWRHRKPLPLKKAADQLHQRDWNI